MFRLLKRWLMKWLRRLLLLGLSVAGVLTAIILFVGREAFFAPELDTDARLASFPAAELPLLEPVTVYWDEHLIPFIVAETDRDLAFTLGLVHAHLRATQMELFRRVVQGRLSESFGLATVEIDEALRILELDRCAREIVGQMPAETLDFLEAYVEGVNHWHARSEPPPAFGLLGLEHEPWKVEDCVGLMRLAGVDVNWFTWFDLLTERKAGRGPAALERALRNGEPSGYSLDSQQALLKSILESVGKVGSNAMAVGPERSASRAPLIASDPHLGFQIPNVWLLAGYRSPSHHCVGLMLPGLPVVTVGRNAELAWGGTNMRSASSDLYELSGRDALELEERTETIAVRFWPDREIVVRESRLGPVLSDAALIPSEPGEVLALHWLGHEPSDEITALLEANQAQSVEDFHRAFANWSVSGQNFVVASAEGEIALVAAARLPLRAYETPKHFPLLASDPQSEWRGRADAGELPLLHSKQGYVVSANNPPFRWQAPIGFYYGRSERFERLSERLAGNARLDLAELAAIQRDTVSPAAAELSKAFARLLLEHQLAGHSSGVYDALSEWPGDYAADSKQAVVFEAFLAELAEGLELSDARWNTVSREILAALEVLEMPARTALLEDAAESAGRAAGSGKRWEERHVVEAGHLLSRIPLLGRFFLHGEIPVAGSRKTVFKAVHPLGKGKTRARYGSQSRHLSDLADPDANYFNLYGGNDGVLGSAHLYDQLEDWRSGGLIQLPLQPETVEARFAHRLELEPE